MRRAILIGLLGALSLFAASVLAQAPARIELGQRVSGTASSEGGEFYAFIGLQGTRLQAQLALPDTLGAVTLYDANGAELARAEGKGSALLSHTLEDDGIYLLGITSAAKGKDYALALDGQVPRIEFVYDDEDEGADMESADIESAKEAPTPAAPPPFVADPAVWGVYARLAGRQSEKKEDRYYLAWVWQRPGEVLVEEWRNPDGSLAHTNTITPTGKPGELLQHSSYLAGKDWDGRLDAEGNVNYVGRGLLKLPYQLGIAADGVLEMRRIKVRGDEVTVVPGGAQTRWVLEPLAP